MVLTTRLNAVAVSSDIRHKFAVASEIPNVRTEHSFVKVLAHGWEWGSTYLAIGPACNSFVRRIERQWRPAGDRTTQSGGMSGIGTTSTPFATRGQMERHRSWAAPDSTRID
jgi:hypothetical protein